MSQPSTSHLPPEEDGGQEGGEGHREERLCGRLLPHLAPKERPLLGKSSCRPPCLPPPGPCLVLTSRSFCSSLHSFTDLLACSLHRGPLGPGLSPTPSAGADTVWTLSLGQWVNVRIRSYPTGISQNLLVYWASLLTPSQP